MGSRARIPLRGLLAFFLLIGLTSASAGFARDLTNVDALASKERARRPLRLPKSRLQELVRPDKPLHTQESLGVPTFLWAAESGQPDPHTPNRKGLSPEQAAREHLGRYLPLYDLDLGEVQSAALGSIHDTGRGAVIVTFRQRVNGIDVFRDEIKLIMDRNLGLVAISGYLAGAPARTARISPPAFGRGPGEALARAYEDLTEIHLPAGDFQPSGKPSGGYDYYRLRDSFDLILERPMVQPARVRKVYFHLPDRLEPAFYVEMNVGGRDSS
ncbi:MAG: hypothetical protein L0191_05880, partial [Acidobacteria bacterium]|nr:hypothetical protein [Acidobacteriota bacterium]